MRRQGLKERLNAALERRVQRQPSKRVGAPSYDWHSAQAREVGEATTASLTERRFPCEQCGAVLDYAVGTNTLECRYCGHRNAILASRETIEELDLHTALERLQNARPASVEQNVIGCSNCAAEFALDAHVHSGECPFCGTNVVTETGEYKLIKPKGLLPFAVTAEAARDAYRKWLRGLWFAPSALQQHAHGDTSLSGVYLPYWTYDSDTATAYTGQRGDVYYVTQRYTTTVNGRRVTRTRQVPKIRWSQASGRTTRHFDDVLVGATRTLPRKITDWLAPWDLENLVPYTEDYLAGFSSEVYQVDLDKGFNIAQKVMDDTIRGDVRRAIGGDRQRVNSLQTRHSDTTFKHVLLPLWSAGFRFRDKTYRFVVNGRTGKVRGERPWSVVKIALAVVAAAVLLVAVLLLVQASGLVSGTGRGLNSGLSSGQGSSQGSGWIDSGIDDSRSGRVLIDWSSEAARTHWPSAPLGDVWHER